MLHSLMNEETYAHPFFYLNLAWEVGVTILFIFQMHRLKLRAILPFRSFLPSTLPLGYRALRHPFSGMGGGPGAGSPSLSLRGPAKYVWV